MSGGTEGSTIGLKMNDALLPRMRWQEQGIPSTTCGVESRATMSWRGEWRSISHRTYRRESDKLPTAFKTFLNLPNRENRRSVIRRH